MSESGKNRAQEEEALRNASEWASNYNGQRDEHIPPGDLLEDASSSNDVSSAEDATYKPNPVIES